MIITKWTLLYYIKFCRMTIIWNNILVVSNESQNANNYLLFSQWILCPIQETSNRRLFSYSPKSVETPSKRTLLYVNNKIISTTTKHTR